MRSFDPEDLLAYAGPLQRLARLLVTDEARADDVVQETWLAALRRPPTEAGNLRGWLFSVARNAARRAGRDEERRRGREERAARPESIVDDAAERATAQRELTDLLLRLEEPYRAVLLLRYFEDQSPMMIAKTLDLPVATVHTRILRGRERLREALLRRFGDRDSWCAALVALALGAPRTSAPPWSGMQTWRFLLPAGLIAAAVGLVAYLGCPDPTEVRAVPVVPHVDEEEETRGDAPPGESGPAEFDPRDLADLGPDAPEPPEEPVIPPVVVVEVPDRGPRSVGHLTRTPRTKAGAPPGLVLVKGGKTAIGTPVKDVEPLILANEQMAKPLAGETPRITVDVGDFFLMPTEVTNEQYGVFLQATDAKPPWTWGGAAVDVARRAFLEEQGGRARAAREEGVAFVRRPFDPERWWENNWRDCEWAIPADQLEQPVVYVSYHDARAYARWAGLRLMTELEFARAARRDTDRVYAWGDEFDVKACSSILSGLGRTSPVGSFPLGAVENVFDLCGNVWEWTSSSYNKFPGYRPVRVKDGKRTIEAIAPWDSNQRVLVGGSFQQNQVGVRISTRMFAERMQSTNALGFRCAASPRKGVDAAQAVLDHDVRYEVLPRDLEFYPQGTVVLESWGATPVAEDEEKKGVSGYLVLTGYERMLFTPVTKVEALSTRQLEDLTVQEGPIYLGLLSIDLPLMEPALVAGTYHVAYRAAGELVEKDDTEEDEDTTEEVSVTVPYTQAMGFETEVAQFLFFDLEGLPLVTMPAGKFSYSRMKGGVGGIRLERWEQPKKVDEDDPPIPMDTLLFQLMVAGRSGSKGFHFDLPLKLEVDTITDDWN